eukprot:TRINITY_DN6587_c0_g1_i3.p1 TRINITY_DN6587_c0_g1~~TRINITY_DN6587_c0_g1_i3.p1  ORF type:complete len:287 (+),score=48.52 TRINITY_DN6587_c0_g1_i3:31-861(+)
MASSASESNARTQEELVCIKVRKEEQQVVFVAPKAASWNQVCREVTARLGNFQSITLQSQKNEEGFVVAGFDAIENDEAWKAAVADHSGGKFHLDEDLQVFLPTVLLECHLASLIEARSTGPLSLETIMASGQSSLDSVKEWLTHTANIDVIDEQGRTALVLACLCSAADVVRLLLEKKACSSGCGKDGFCALHHAVLNNETEIVNLLLAAGANPNEAVAKTTRTRLVTTSVAGQTALHLACERKYCTCASMLLKAGCDASLLDEDGNRAALERTS